MARLETPPRGPATGLHRITRGLDLPIEGAPSPTLARAQPGRTVALLGADYVGLRPSLRVRPGDEVQRGDLLFADKNLPGVRFTAPASGTVLAIHRGEKRAFTSLVIELSRAEHEDAPSAQERPERQHPRDLPREAVVERLLQSGEWTALRQRPFSRIADPRATPSAVFVTAIDTRPLAPPIGVMLQDREADLEHGMHALTKLTDGPVFVCTDSTTELALPSHARIRLERFMGPHPAGTVGVHIHRLHPVDRTRTVWHIGVQDLLAIGALFRTGHRDVERIVALSGPAVRSPRLLRVQLGASIPDLCDGETVGGEVRLVSGSVLCGRSAMGEAHGFLGRYHQQISAILEERDRELLGWMGPGSAKFSVTATFLSRLLRRSRFALGSSTGGSPRAIVPIGLYEKVLPMDLEPTFLLKAIMMQDADWAEKLGCLELDEEDLSLCAFVCPGKSDFGAHLREVLTVLAEEDA